MFQIEGEVSCGNHVGILNYVNQFWDFFFFFWILLLIGVLLVYQNKFWHGGFNYNDC